MGNRRVESLTYRLETDDTVSFDANPVEHETNAFSLRLEEDELTVDLREHFSSVEEAHKQVDPFLEAWEVKYGTQFRQREIRFSYEDAEVVHEDTGDNKIVQEALRIRAEASANIVAHIERSEYPDPPTNFAFRPTHGRSGTGTKGMRRGESRCFPWVMLVWTF